MAADREFNPDAKVTVDGNDARLTVVGDVDAASAAMLERRLDEVIRSSTGAVVVDMSGVTFVDSMGIRVLVGARLRLSQQQRALTLRDVSKPTRRNLDLAGLSPVFDLDEDGRGTDEASLRVRVRSERRRVEVRRHDEELGSSEPDGR